MPRPTKIRRLDKLKEKASISQDSESDRARIVESPVLDGHERNLQQSRAGSTDLHSRAETVSPSARQSAVFDAARDRTTPAATVQAEVIKIEDPAPVPVPAATAVTTTPGCITLAPGGDLLLILTKLWRKPLHDSLLSILNKYNAGRIPLFTSLPSQLHVRVSRDYLRIVAASFLTTLTISEDEEGSAYALLDDRGEAALMLLLVIFNKSNLLPEKLDWLDMKDVFLVVNKYSLHEVTYDRLQIWKASLKVPDWRPIEVVEAILYVGWAGKMGKAIVEEILRYHLFKMDDNIMMTEIVVPEKLRVAVKDYNAQRAKAKWNLLMNIHQVLQEFLTAAKGTLCCMKGNKDARIPNKCHAAQLGSVVMGLHNSPYFGTAFCSNPGVKNPHSLNRLLDAFVRVEVWTTCCQPGPCSRFPDRAKRLKDLVAKEVDEIIGNFLQAWIG